MKIMVIMKNLELTFVPCLSVNTIKELMLKQEIVSIVMTMKFNNQEIQVNVQSSNAHCLIKLSGTEHVKNVIEKTLYSHQMAKAVSKHHAQTEK